MTERNCHLHLAIYEIGIRPISLGFMPISTNVCCLHLLLGTSDYFWVLARQRALQLIAKYPEVVGVDLPLHMRWYHVQRSRVAAPRPVRTLTGLCIDTGQILLGR